jgi:hypothetical protein
LLADAELRQDFAEDVRDIDAAGAAGKSISAAAEVSTDFRLSIDLSCVCIEPVVSTRTWITC